MIFSSRPTPILAAVGVAAICLPACTARAQLRLPVQERSHPTSTVFVVPVTAPDASSASAGIARFTEDMLRFSLARNTGVVVATGVDPQCSPVSLVQQQSKEPRPAPEREKSYAIYSQLSRRPDSSFTVSIVGYPCGSAPKKQLFEEFREFDQKSVAIELQSAAALITEQVREALLPTILVRASTADPTDDKISPNPWALVRQIENEIVRTGAYAPVDSGADFELLASLLPRSARNADSVLVQMAQYGDTSRLLFFSVSRRDSERTESFAQRGAREIALRAAEFLHSIELGGDPYSLNKTPATVVASARKVLCLDSATSCSPDPEAAAAAIRALGDAVLQDVDALAILGRAELMQGSLSDALMTFRKALRLLDEGKRPGVSEASARELHTAIGDIYRQNGSGLDAINEYRRALGGARPDAAMAVKMSESLRIADKQIDALNVAADVLRREPNDSLLVRQAVLAIDRIAPAQLSLEAMKVEYACGASPLLRAQCGGAFARATVRADRERQRPELVRQLATQALFFAPRSPSIVALAAAMKAATFAGPTSHLADPSVRYVYVAIASFTADSVAAYLKLAHEQPVDSMSQETRELVARLPALQEIERRRETAAFGHLRDARSVLITRDGSVLYAQVGIALISQLRLRAADSATSRVRADSLAALRNEVRSVLDTAVRLYPRDHDLLDLRSKLCGEYAVDLGCYYDANRAMLYAGWLRQPREIMDAVEAAVLVDSIAAGRQWMRRIRVDSLYGCERAVAGLLGFWIARAPEAPAREVTEYFSQFNRGVSEHRVSRSLPCWMWSGMKTRLARDPQLPHSQTLSAMIRAMEDASAPLPTLP